jgi:hypothetical protein
MARVTPTSNQVRHPANERRLLEALEEDDKRVLTDLLHDRPAD